MGNFKNNIKNEEFNFNTRPLPTKELDTVWLNKFKSTWEKLGWTVNIIGKVYVNRHSPIFVKLDNQGRYLAVIKKGNLFLEISAEFDALYIADSEEIADELIDISELTEEELAEYYGIEDDNSFNTAYKSWEIAGTETNEISVWLRCTRDDKLLKFSHNAEFFGKYIYDLDELIDSAEDISRCAEEHVRDCYLEEAFNEFQKRAKAHKNEDFHFNTRPLPAKELDTDWINRFKSTWEKLGWTVDITGKVYVNRHNPIFVDFDNKSENFAILKKGDISLTIYPDFCDFYIGGGEEHDEDIYLSELTEEELAEYYGIEDDRSYIKALENCENYDGFDEFSVWLEYKDFDGVSNNEFFEESIYDLEDLIYCAEEIADCAEYYVNEYYIEESLNELQKRAKQHKKTDKKGARGWFVNPNAGNVEANVAFFNHASCGSSLGGISGACCEDLDEPVEKSPIKFKLKNRYIFTLYPASRFITFFDEYDKSNNGYKRRFYNRIPETTYQVLRDTFESDKLLRKTQNREVLKGVREFFSRHKNAKYCIISAEDVSKQHSEDFPHFANTYRVLSEPYETKLGKENVVVEKTLDKDTEIVYNNHNEVNTMENENKKQEQQTLTEAERVSSINSFVSSMMSEYSDVMEKLGE